MSDSATHNGAPAAGSLTGRNVVLLGASSGIGQCVGRHALAAGADVLLCGRRGDRLEELKAEAEMSGGGQGTTCAVDIASEADTERLARTVKEFGLVDVVISTVGAAPLKPVDTMTRDDWLQVMQTNVVGINCAIQSMLPSLKDGALVLAFSSEAVTMPRWALTAYSSSKAALEVSFAGWRLEYPRLRFGTVAVGATMPTEFGRTFGDEILGAAIELWVRHGQAQESFMNSEEVGQALVGIVASLLPFPGIGMEHIVLRTPSPVVGSSDLMRAAALD